VVRETLQVLTNTARLFLPIEMVSTNKDQQGEPETGTTFNADPTVVAKCLR
jgi:hypothetical protein